MAHRLKSKFDSRGRPGVESLWGQRSSGTKEAEESRGAFGDKEVWGQRRQGRAGEPPGTKKSGDKGGRLSHPSNPAGTLAGIPAGSSLIKSLKV